MSDQPTNSGVESQPNIRAQRLGVILFALYTALYGGFIYLAAFRPEVMSSTPFGGVNLAIWYGMALIVVPLLLAGIYLLLCKRGGH